MNKDEVEVLTARIHLALLHHTLHYHIINNNSNNNIIQELHQHQELVLLEQICLTY